MTRLTCRGWRMSNTKVDVGITRCVISPYLVWTKNVDISMVNYLRMAHQMHMCRSHCLSLFGWDPKTCFFALLSTFIARVIVYYYYCWPCVHTTTVQYLRFRVQFRKQGLVLPVIMIFRLRQRADPIGTEAVYNTIRDYGFSWRLDSRTVSPRSWSVLQVLIWILFPPMTVQTGKSFTYFVMSCRSSPNASRSWACCQIRTYITHSLSINHSSPPDNEESSSR